METLTETKKEFLKDLIPNDWGLESNLLEQDFPSRKSEYWKYTRLNKLSKKQFKQTKNTDTRTSIDLKLPIENIDNHLVFVNGVFSEHLSAYKSESIEIKSKKSTQTIHPTLTNTKDHFFSSVNHVYAQDGVEVSIQNNKQAAFVFITNLLTAQGAASILKNTFEIKEGCTAEIIFNTKNTDQKIATHSNISHEFRVGANAEVNFYHIQTPNNHSSIIETLDCTIEDKATFSSHYFSTGGELIRTNINTAFNGEFATSTFNGIVLGKENNHIDHHTLIDHKVPNCESHELYKIVCSDKATGVFNGKVFVREDAQKTNAFQSSQGILLSDNANIFSKPELEIYADDVKCSHGSTTGQLDEQALFYLMSRGIGAHTAKQMLVGGFVAEVITQMPNKDVQQWVTSLVEQYFANN